MPRARPLCRHCRNSFGAVAAVIDSIIFEKAASFFAAICGVLPYLLPIRYSRQNYFDPHPSGSVPEIFFDAVAGSPAFLGNEPSVAVSAYLGG
jgi:hypothetical protein